MMTPWTVNRIKTCKGREKIVSLTAYDYATARMLDESGIHLILIGDSLGMTMLGYENTLPVTVEDMLHHSAAVVRGVKHALVISDMPFLSYQVSHEEALRNAGRLVQKAGVGGVKIEGGAFRAPLVTHLVRNGIPVLGHIGMTPQSVKAMGGFKVQGRRPKEARQLIADARALEKAGVFAIVLECIPAPLAKLITRAVKIPTIGIGAGPYCDGQILVTHDILGLYTGTSPKFAKRYADLGRKMRSAFSAYRKDVSEGTFPTPDYSY
jgi:3-methyl-2-oxobutanoate hydroxymethyltransferase